MTYTFINVKADYTIEAIFKPLQKWVKRYNNDPVNDNDEASDLTVDPSGNVYVTGYSIGKTSGEDFYTIRYNSKGVESWSARYDGPAHLGDYAHAIVVDALGNSSETGISYRGNVHKHADYCTVKYNSSGEEVWDAQYDDRRNGNDVATAITLDSAGNVYITGRSEYSMDKKSTVLHHDFLTIKYDADTGKMAWEGRYDNTNVENAQDEAVALAVDSAGNTYVTGRSQGSDTGFDYVTIKYDSSGNEEWVHRYNNELVNGNDEASDMVLDSAGNIYVTGRSQGSGTGYDYCTIKYNSEGNMVWRVRYNHSDGDDEARAVVVDSAGNVYVTGRSKGNGTGFDYATVKYEQ